MRVLSRHMRLVFSLLVHSTYKLHSLLSVCVCVCMHVCDPLYFNLEKKEIDKRRRYELNVWQYTHPYSKTGKIMRTQWRSFGKKNYKNDDTRVMHTNVWWSSLYMSQNIFSRDFDMPRMCRKCFALSENIKTSWIFMYIYACPVSSSITSLCEIW